MRIRSRAALIELELELELEFVAGGLACLACLAQPARAKSKLVQLSERLEVSEKSC